MSVNSFDNYPMSWKPDFSRTSGPKYLALVKMLEEDIKSGTLRAGTKLPPQRELADFLNINLSTVSRAFKLCEQKGLLSASVGSGTFVSSDATAETLLLCEENDKQLIEMGAIIPFVASNHRVKQYMENLLKRQDSLNLFSYGIPEGTKRHRDAGVTWLRKSGFTTDSDHILLAAGGQNALTASLGACFERGDNVGTDPLTYPGVKTAAKLLGIHLIPIQNKNHEMTEEGIRYASRNENIKGLYVIPDFHNPTTHTMSLETRKMIADIAAKQNLLVIEDSINNLLTQTPLPPIASFAPESVLYLSSLSKTVSAGLRTAFIHVPHQNRQKLITTLYSMNISISPLLATVAAGLIEENIAGEILEERKQKIAERNRLFDEILFDESLFGESLQDIHLKANKKGINIEGSPTSPLRYLHLPDIFTGQSFEQCAYEAGVQVYGAERFAVGNKPVPNTIRISVTTPQSDELLAEGARRLRKLLLSSYI